MTAGTLAAVFVGGGGGALARYGLARAIGERYGGEFPLGTFAVNVSGCFALGIVASLSGLTSPLRDLLATGFLGGYTTFSTYALEGIVLSLEGARRTATIALAAPILAGIAAAALGAAVANALSGG